MNARVDCSPKPPFGWRDRCKSCSTPDDGWSEAHLLISSTGQRFCSRTCIERYEDATGEKVVVVEESGRVTHPDWPYERVSS